MAFRKKVEYILTELPDILVIPECECPAKLIFKKDNLIATDIYWYGDNPNKGLGVFSYSDFRITPFPDHNTDFRYIIPLRIESKEEKIYLIAVWALKPFGHDNYGIHIWNAINYYTELLKNEKIIIMGDFNSSTIWDKPNREANHSNIVKFLNNSDFDSTYHFFHNQEQGKEKDPTLYLQRKIDRPYHIDYCFASRNLIRKLKDVRVGKYEDWSKYSDHKPVIVTFEN